MMEIQLKSLLVRVNASLELVGFEFFGVDCILRKNKYRSNSCQFQTNTSIHFSLEG